MLDQINEGLLRAKEQVRAKRKLEAMLRETQQVLDDAHQRCNAHRRRLEAEKADVDKLEGLGLTALFYTILGTKREHLQKEKEEYLAARLKYESAAKTVEEVLEEVQGLRTELGEFTSSEAEYERLLDEKERLLAQAGGDRAKQLLGFSERLADFSAKHKELREALEAGGQASAALQQVQSDLHSAANWGTWDLLGGGLLVTMAKHSRIDAAREHAHTAQRHLRSFQKELADADKRLGVSLDIGVFVTFADYFFDGLIADWIMQSKIQNASSTCSSAISKVSAVLGECHRRLAEVERAREDVKSERREYLEQG
ncbi:MAG: hypothetical protein ACYC4N_12635 [Pirellulaceae bacterium]